MALIDDEERFFVVNEKGDISPKILAQHSGLAALLESMSVKEWWLEDATRWAFGHMDQGTKVYIATNFPGWCMVADVSTIEEARSILEEALEMEIEETIEEVTESNFVKFFRVERESIGSISMEAVEKYEDAWESLPGGDSIPRTSKKQ